MSKNSAPDSPSPHGSNGGQDERGRFVPGNKLGRGNPHAGRAAKIRAVLLQKLTDEDVAQIADKLIAMAKEGDLAAARELFDRTVGKSGHTEMYERLEKLESGESEYLDEKTD